MVESLKTITCSVCGYETFPKRGATVKTGVGLVESMFWAPTYWDVMDCPMCRCQITLKAREVMEYPITEDSEAPERND